MRGWGLLVVMLVLALPGSAGAAGTPVVPWFGMYTATVSGGQQTSWTLNDPGDGECRVSETGSGNERIDIPGARAGNFIASGIGPSVVQLAPVGDPDVQATALVTRSGSITDGPAPPGAADECPSGGGDDSAPPAGPDCGLLSLPWAFSLRLGGLGLHVAPPYDASVDGEQGFHQCPAQDTQWPGVTEADIPVPRAGLGPAPPLGTGGAPVELRAVGVPAPFGDGLVNGTTTSTLVLRLVGVAFPTVAVFEDVRDVPVDSGGRAGVPVSCPKGVPRCAGRVALAVSAGDGDDVKYPAPVPDGESPLSSASFSLKGGHHTTARVDLHTTSASSLSDLSEAGLDVVVTPSGSGRRATPYVVGQVTLRKGS